MNRAFWGKRDPLFVLLLAVLASVFWFFAGRGAAGDSRCAEVKVDGRVAGILPLDEDRLFVPQTCPGVRISVRGGRVGFAHSDCPDRVCVHAGFLSLPGQTAVCLPNRVVLRVVAKEGAPSGEALDSVVY